MAQKRNWSAAAKFEIALLAIKGEMTINEICTQYEVAPSQVYAWKKQLLEQGSHLFGQADKKVAVQAEQERTLEKLYAKIGQLTVERDFLKKAWGRVREKNDDT
jgi:transposase